LGFNRIFIPGLHKDFSEKEFDITVVKANRVEDVFRLLFRPAD